MKKLINVALIVFVLSLWGTIIYKYLNNFFYSENKIINENIKQYSLIKINERDTFNLTQLQKDPFLGESYSTNTIQKNYRTRIVEKKSGKSTQNALHKQKPTIQYFGMIKSSGKKDELIILKINNVIRKLRLNSEYDGVRIKKVFKDSIMISFNNEKEYIRR